MALHRSTRATTRRCNEIKFYQENYDNIVGIICPLIGIGLNYLPKSEGTLAPPPHPSSNGPARGVQGPRQDDAMREEKEISPRKLLQRTMLPGVDRPRHRILTQGDVNHFFAKYEKP